MLTALWLSAALGAAGCGGRNAVTGYSGLPENLSQQKEGLLARDQISQGMSQDEVRQELGLPDEFGAETEGEHEYLFWAYKPGRHTKKFGWDAWHTIRFKDGHVEDAMTASHPILSLASWQLEQRMLEEQAASIRADKALEHNKLGVIYFKKGLYNEAIIEYKKSIKLDPNNADSHYNLGYAYHAIGKQNLAAQEFEEALRLNPADAEGHTNLCLVYFNMGKAEEAITECQKALRLDSTDPVTHFNLGYIYRQMHKYRAAVAEYEQALHLGMDTSDLHYSLGEGYSALEKWQLAVERFQKALELDPEHFQAKQGLERARGRLEAR